MIKNGKLFGKLNIIDLLIILVIIAAAVFLGLRMRGGSESVVSETAAQKAELTFFAYEAPGVVEGKAHPGDKVTNFETRAVLGELLSYECEPTHYTGYNDGETVTWDSLSFVNLTFTTTAEGIAADTGLIIGGMEYCIGGSYTMYAGNVRVYCRLADIVLVD